LKIQKIKTGKGLNEQNLFKKTIARGVKRIFIKYNFVKNITDEMKF